MKRDFSQQMVALGAQLPDNVATLDSVCVGALMGVYADEQGLSGDEKFRRYKLAERIAKGGIQEVSAEDIALLKKLIGKNWPPAVLGPAYEALERDALDSPETGEVVAAS